MLDQIAPSMHNYSTTERLDELHVRMMTTRALERRVSIETVVRRAVIDVGSQRNRCAPEFRRQLRLQECRSHPPPQRVNELLCLTILELLMLVGVTQLNVIMLGKHLLHAR